MWTCRCARRRRTAGGGDDAGRIDRRTGGDRRLGRPGRSGRRDRDAVGRVRCGGGDRTRRRATARRDDPRVAVHRPGRLGPVGRGPGVRGGAAVSERRRRHLYGVPHRARRHARGRPIRGAGGPHDRRERDAGARAAGADRADHGALAGAAGRGRRPADRAGRQRAAQGDRGTAAADGLSAVYAVDAPGRRVGDDPVAMSRRDAAPAVGRGGRVGAHRAATAPIPRRPPGPPRRRRVTSAGPGAWPGIRMRATGGPRCSPSRAG